MEYLNYFEVFVCSVERVFRDFPRCSNFLALSVSPFYKKSFAIFDSPELSIKAL